MCRPRSLPDRCGSLAAVRTPDGAPADRCVITAIAVTRPGSGLDAVATFDRGLVDGIGHRFAGEVVEPGGHAAATVVLPRPVPMSVPWR